MSSCLRSCFLSSAVRPCQSAADAAPDVAPVRPAAPAASAPPKAIVTEPNPFLDHEVPANWRNIFVMSGDLTMHGLTTRWRRTMAPLYARVKRMHDRCGPEQISRKSWLARVLCEWEGACKFVYSGNLSRAIMLEMLAENNFILSRLDSEPA